MRVALITEGTYPYHPSGASTWCHRLVTGMSRHSYHILALTTTPDPAKPAYPMTGNVTGITTVPVWGAPKTAPGRLARLRTRRAATGAAVLLCRGLLGNGRHHAAQFRDGLVKLAQLSAGGAHPLAGTPLADVLADAWRASRAGPGGAASDPAVLPRLSLRDAESAALLLEHALRPLAATVPPADLCHATSSGLPLLVALAARWRTGTPYLLSEQGIYLRERYLDYGPALPGAVKTVMLGFFRALAQLGYTEAALATGASRFNQRWQLRHGAHPARVVVVPDGVRPTGFPLRAEPPRGHTIVWVGRIEPLKDLHTLIHAFWRVRRALPVARLRLVGPTADEQYAAGCRALVRRLSLAEVVTFAGPVANASDAYAGAQVVARSSVSEGTPYAVIEAMLTGRATVSTNVGGVAELVGETGLVVPPGDPAAFGDALLELLRDAPRRRALGEAAARRARAEFGLDRTLRAYHQLYLDVACPPPIGPPASGTPTHAPRLEAPALEVPALEVPALEVPALEAPRLGAARNGGGR